jgi:hypothetical protein
MAGQAQLITHFASPVTLRSGSAGARLRFVSYMPFAQPGAAEAPEFSTADENFVIAEMVRQGIRKARERLNRHCRRQ